MDEFEKLQRLLENFSQILAISGFENNNQPNPLRQQVQFQRQISFQTGILDVTVQTSVGADEPWHTANIEFRSLGSENLPTVRNLPIKRFLMQVTSSKNTQVSIANYRQCSMHVYLLHPISYQNEDFLYQARVTRDPKLNLSLGVTWLRPEMQLQTAEVIEIIGYVKVLLSQWLS